MENITDIFFPIWHLRNGVCVAPQPLRPWAVAAPLLLLLCILFKKCKSRSSWLNCAFEVMKLIIDVTGPVEGIFAFIYWTEWRSGQVLLMPHSLTDWQTLKERVTQLLMSIRVKLSQRNCPNVQKIQNQKNLQNRANMQNLHNWSKQSMPGSGVPLVMFIFLTADKSKGYCIVEENTFNCL